MPTRDQAARRLRDLRADVAALKTMLRAEEAAHREAIRQRDEACAERDEFRASFLELYETTRRYREALGRYADEANWREYFPRSVQCVYVGTPHSHGYDDARAALTAPDASGQATEGQP